MLNGLTGTVAIGGVAGVQTIAGQAAGDQLGYAVATAPLFAPAQDDWVFSARGAGSGAGRVYAMEPTALPVTLAAELQFNGSTTGEGAGEYLEIADFGLGTTAQVAIGAVGTDPEEGVNPAGRVYVVDFADAMTAPTPANARCVSGESLNDFFGFSLAAGDFEGTAATDLAVGAIYADRTGMDAATNTGAVFVFTGVAGLAAGACPAADATADHIVRGFRQWDQLGFSLAAGQFDGAGNDDLAMGSRLHDRDQLSFLEVDEGAVYVVFGGGGFGGWPTDLICADAGCDSGAPAGVDAMYAGGDYANAASDEIGFSLAAGDWNQDAIFDDLAVGSVAHGRVYLISVNDQDGDGRRDIRDNDDDNDGVPDALDDDPLDPTVCRDQDGDSCDDCSVGVDGFGPLPDFDVDDDGTDTDGDGACDLGDPDDDNDGVDDGADASPLNPDICGDTDSDTCDDCAVGTDDFGAQSDSLPDNDGTDTDSDGLCNAGDPDDDNDGVNDGPDTSDLDPDVCADADGDGCDDCSVGTDGFGPLADNLVGNDGLDTDSDGACDNGDFSVTAVGDDDDDNDGVLDGADLSRLNPNVCRDLDGDTCDDCSVGTDGFGPLPDFDPANDGPDADMDGICNLGDTDTDGDGVPNGSDADPFDNTVCSDTDGDGCDDCASTTFNPANDGTDTDSDGLCNVGDADDDNDGVPDAAPDPAPLNPDVCGDADSDTCDDCSVGTDGFGPLADNDAANDGPDADMDGLCDAGDPDADGDGVDSGTDSDDSDPFVCQDTDGDTCDDCSSGMFDPAADGTDTDSDGACDAGDADDDNDGVADAAPDPAPLDPDVCGDADGDSCDDCSVGTDDFGPLADNDPANDGTDGDGDGFCLAGDCNDAIDTCTTDCTTDADMNMVPDCEEVPVGPGPTSLTIDRMEGDEIAWTGGFAPAYMLVRGDLGVLRATGDYTQEPGSHPAAEAVCGLTQSSWTDAWQPAPGAVAFYLVGAEGGGEAALGRDSAGNERPNRNACN